MPSITTLKGVPAKIIAWHRELIEIQTNREGPCWIWTKSLNWDGYATTSLGGRSITVHRVSYLIHKGDIPTGMVVRHCCPGGENRACVNPDHLILGSTRDNNRDTVLHGKGGKGGPKPESQQLLWVETAALASDAIIFEMARRRFKPSSIAQRLGLPREHIIGVINAICDREGRREGTRFESRFWSKVQRTESCWMWSAMKVAGYGRISVNGKLVGAHQVSWRLHRGPIAKGLVVCHNCPEGDTSLCVNPQHLYLATQTENLRHGLRKRHWAQLSVLEYEFGQRHSGGSDLENSDES